MLAMTLVILFVVAVVALKQFGKVKERGLLTAEEQEYLNTSSSKEEVEVPPTGDSQQNKETEFLSGEPLKTEGYYWTVMAVPALEKEIPVKKTKKKVSKKKTKTTKKKKTTKRTSK